MNIASSCIGLVIPGRYMPLGDLGDFKKNYGVYMWAGHHISKAGPGVIKELAGLKSHNLQLVMEGARQVNKDAWTNPNLWPLP